MSGRRQRDTVDYFPFFVNEGRTTRYIENAYGNEGFAIWVKILRELAKTPNHYIDISEDVILLDLVALCKVPENRFMQILKDLARFGVFSLSLLENHKIIFCEEFTQSLEPLYVRRGKDLMYENDIIGIINGNIDSGNEETANNTLAEIPQSKVKESKVKESKKEKIYFEKYFKVLDQDILKKIGPGQFKLITNNEFSWPSDEEIFKKIIDWLEYKKQRGEVYKATNGINAILKKISRHGKGDVLKGFDKSMASNYAGLFINGTSRKSFKKDEYDKKESWT